MIVPPDPPRCPPWPTAPPPSPPTCRHLTNRRRRVDPPAGRPRRSHRRDHRHAAGIRVAGRRRRQARTRCDIRTCRRTERRRPPASGHHVPPADGVRGIVTVRPQKTYPSSQVLPRRGGHQMSRASSASRQRWTSRLAHLTGDDEPEISCPAARTPPASTTEQAIAVADSSGARG